MALPQDKRHALLLTPSRPAPYRGRVLGWGAAMTGGERLPRQTKTPAFHKG
jgi:hypothetical protein